LILGFAVPLLLLPIVVLAPGPTVDRALGSLRDADPSANLRWWFWDGTLRMVRDHWLAGVGPGNYAYWSPRYLGEALWAENGESLSHNEVLTEHAHSEPLNLLAETGVVGIVLLLWMFVRVARRPGAEWGGLIALGVFVLFHAPLRSPPHLVAAGIYVSTLLARPFVERNDEAVPACGSHSRVLGYVLGALALGQLAYVVVAVVIPSRDLRHAMDIHLVQGGPAALDAYERVLRQREAPSLAHEKYGIALLEAARLDDAQRQFEVALEGMDTGGVYLALGALAHHRGDYVEARRLLEACVWRWPSNWQAWTLLMSATPPVNRPEVIARARRWLPERAVRGLGSMPGS
jgi:tetratricopeptide (TPR) repeat protein